jgi:hypothetical protein
MQWYAGSSQTGKYALGEKASFAPPPAFSSDIHIVVDMHASVLWSMTNAFWYFDFCRGCHFLLGARVMACIVSSSSQVALKTVGSGHWTRRRQGHIIMIFLKMSSRLPGKGLMFWSVGW